jgi:hypothetical protein
VGQTLAGRGSLVRARLIRLIGPPSGNQPDEHPTSGMSGGVCRAYGIVLPDACVDGLFPSDTTTALMSYLNRVSERDFPGLRARRISDR